ncbi:zinc finger BED domain-containing protein isoform X2 [Ctenopharyngodon idella]|uniref:zinc finger BED domain-containing protein isoform X2 n=1 Tax=Ctenopharyngodon idella TaxID=7959 RepID=UPI0022329185|nr:zinc finger BED domain-containing protein isoform X2 [Ctenopharyngodon idella]
MAARKRSIVWSFFQAEDDRRVLCLLCMKTVLYFGHTTNMLRHLRTKHPSDFSSLDKRKPATDAVSKRNDTGCVEVLMDEQQVEVESVGEDGEMDGAIKGILRAAAGEGTAEAEVADEEGEGPVDEGDGKEIQEDEAPGNTRKWSSVWVHYRKLGQEPRALCLLCMEKIQHRSSTSNLIRHLQHKHPNEFAQLEDHPQKRPNKRKSEDPSRLASSPTLASGTPTRSQIVSPKRDVRSPCSTSLDRYSGAKWSEGVRILERERELTEALRRVQQEEGRSIQLQKELLQQFREMDAERRVLQNQKCEQEQEHARLRKEKEDLQKEKNELQREKEEMQKEREEFQKEKEELEKQKQELDSWKNSHAQGQTAGFYNC